MGHFGDHRGCGDGVLVPDLIAHQIAVTLLPAYQELTVSLPGQDFRSDPLEPGQRLCDGHIECLGNL